MDIEFNPPFNVEDQYEHKIHLLNCSWALNWNLWWKKENSRAFTLWEFSSPQNRLFLFHFPKFLFIFSVFVKNCFLSFCKKKFKSILKKKFELFLSFFLKLFRKINFMKPIFWISINNIFINQFLQKMLNLYKIFPICIRKIEKLIFHFLNFPVFLKNQKPISNVNYVGQLFLPGKLLNFSRTPSSVP